MNSRRIRLFCCVDRAVRGGRSGAGGNGPAADTCGSRAGRWIQSDHTRDDGRRATRAAALGPFGVAVASSGNIIVANGAGPVRIRGHGWSDGGSALF